MSKHYGDLPCVKLNGIVHITVSGTKCLCGCSYAYGRPSRSDKKCVNLIWRKPGAVTCVKCKELYIASLVSSKEIMLVSPSDNAEGFDCTGEMCVDDIKKGT